MGMGMGMGAGRLRTEAEGGLSQVEAHHAPFDEVPVHQVPLQGGLSSTRPTSVPQRRRTKTPTEATHQNVASGLFVYY